MCRNNGLPVDESMSPRFEKSENSTDVRHGNLQYSCGLIDVSFADLDPCILRTQVLTSQKQHDSVLVPSVDDMPVYIFAGKTLCFNSDASRLINLL
jgi:hypothetical protein